MGLNGIFWLAVAIIHKPHDWFTLAAGTYGVLFIAAVLISPLIDKKYSLVIDENGVRGHVRWRQDIDLAWKDIVSAELGSIYLRLHTSDGKVETINLGNVSNQNRKELEPQLEAVLSEHGLLMPAGAERKSP